MTNDKGERLRLRRRSNWGLEAKKAKLTFQTQKKSITSHESRARARNTRTRTRSSNAVPSGVFLVLSAVSRRRSSVVMITNTNNGHETRKVSEGTTVFLAKPGNITQVNVDLDGHSGYNTENRRHIGILAKRRHVKHNPTLQ